MDSSEVNRRADALGATPSPLRTRRVAGQICTQLLANSRISVDQLIPVQVEAPGAMASLSKRPPAAAQLDAQRGTASAA